MTRYDDYVGDFRSYVDGEQNNITKRRKLNNDDDFKPGNIIKVIVRNFTTYSYAEFKLSPTLNMIIGPNGSGKSTLVSAICLGLGGKLDLIKRKSMKSMIKTGFDNASIEIVLKGKKGGENVTIKREMTERSSTWYTNGGLSDERSVKNICKSLNIQLDNLCQFLPQERVAEFAGLLPEKLLFEMERTVTSGHLLEMHKDLIDKDSEREKILQEVNEYNTKLEYLEQERDTLQEEVRKYKEYEEKSKELEYHRMLIPYAKLQDLKEKQKHIKRQRDVIKKKIDYFQSCVSPLITQIEKYKKDFESQKSEVETRKSEMRELQSHLDELREEKERTRETITQLQMTKTSLANRTEVKKKESESIRQEIQELKVKLEDIPQIDERELEAQKRTRDIRHNEMNDLKNQVYEIQDNLNAQISKLRNKKEKIQSLEAKLNSNDKFVILENSIRSRNDLIDNVFNAHMYLRTQADFKDRYFEAPIISCDITEKKYAKFIEKVIDANTLFAFTLSDASSYDALSNLLFSKFNAPVRLTKPLKNPSVPREKLSSFGFDGYLSDYITGPKDVLNMLNVISKLDMIPVSNKPLDEGQLQKLLAPDAEGRIPFMRFVAGEHIFTVTRSRYGSRQFFYTSEVVPEARFFGIAGLTQQAKEQIKKDIVTSKSEYVTEKSDVEQLRERINELRNKQSTATETFEQIKSDIDRMQKIKNARIKLEIIISQKEDRHKKVEADTRKDLTDKIRHLNVKIRDKNKVSSDLNYQVSSQLSKLTEILIDIEKKEFLLLQSKNKVLNGERLINSLSYLSDALKNAYEKAKEKYNEIKKSDAAKKIREQSEKYTEEQRNTLSSLAETYLSNGRLTESYINEKIKLIEDERSVMSTADKGSISRFEKTLVEIESLKKGLPTLNHQKAQLDSRIQKIFDKWEPELSQITASISRSFQRRFTGVAVDGRVDLVKSEHFKDWRLEILVRFRENSELKVLDHQSQSGGERAVSTIFFIMSLQDHTNVPFRVVDEINQGMDPKNERLAHKYLVECACESGSSQYFLVTPKLLTGLFYHEKMTIHCIYTSGLLPSAEDSGNGFMDFRNMAVSVT